MPDMWTHLITGDRVLAGLEVDSWHAHVQEHRRVFDFGCQGTDFFFYYHFWPWVKDKSAAAIGETVHHERCRDFHQAVFAYLKSIKNTESYVLGVVYALGLLCHWAVDRNTHPYIHYISGFYDKNDPATHHLIANHKRIEAAIDAILAKEYWGLELHKVPANQRFDLGPELPAEIADIYAQVIPRLYPSLWVKQQPDCIQQSYKDMMHACRFFFDPTGIKKGFFAVAGKSINAAAYFYQPKLNPQADYLNRERRTWVHPADEHEAYDVSLDDLLYLSIAEAGGMIEASLAWLNDELHTESWLQILGNLSFSTGKDCDQDIELKHSKPILD